MEAVGLVAVGVVLLAALALKIFFVWGNTNLAARVEKRTLFSVTEEAADRVTLAATFPFENSGAQCATVVDCVARPQLPYEQYDGIEVWGKIERADTPREDDYFEATLVDSQEVVPVRIVVRLTARHGMDIRTALTHMVDLPIDIIYTQLGRRPWVLRKVRTVLTAEEIAAAVGVELTDD
ncbi:MAG: hypothetical protein ACTTKW_08750 [Schwartzia sp. (in: firmicutes)]